MDFSPFVEQGFSFFALPKATKIPSGPWAQYQIQKPSAELLREWTDHDGNVAVVTGALSGIVVVDVDVHRGGNVREILDKYPTGRVVKTGKGGAHLYYRHPQTVTISNRVNILPGVDIRGDGGYVIAPPSIHPETGAQYEWINTGPMAPFPTELLETSERQKPERGQWISELLAQKIPPGSRNASLASLAGYFAAQPLPEDIALSICRMWGTRQGLPAHEIESTVASVYRTASRRAKPIVEPMPEGVKVSGSDDLRFLGFGDFMARYGGTPVDWVIHGWIPDRTIAFVVAPPESYKTWLLTDLAVSVATGTPFLGTFPVLKPGPVFLVQQEDFHGQTAERIAVIRSSRVAEDTPDIEEDEIVFDAPKGMPLYIHPDRKLHFTDTKAVAGLVKAVEELRPRLVIIDPLYAAVDVDDYMSQAAPQMMILKELRDKYGTSFMIAHHANKGKDKDRTRAWGSQFINAFLETGWQIFQEKVRNSIKVVRHFKAAKAEREICLSFDIETETGWHYSVVEGLVDGQTSDKDNFADDPVDEEDDQEVERAAEEARERSVKRKREVEDCMIDVGNYFDKLDRFETAKAISIGSGVSPWYLAKVLSRLVRDGVVIKRGGKHPRYGPSKLLKGPRIS